MTVDELRNLYDNCMATIGVNEKPTEAQLQYCVKVSEMFFQCLENPALREFLFEEGKGNMN